MGALTVSDLGARFKQKFPGELDDLPDDVVGRRVKEKFTGEFDDFADAPARPLLPPSPLASVQRPPANPDLLTPPSPDEPTPATMVAPAGLPRSLGGGDLPPAAPTPFNLPAQPLKKPIAPSGPIGPLPDVTAPTEFKPAELQNEAPPAPTVKVAPSPLFQAMPIDPTTGKPHLFTPPPPAGPEVSAARRAAQSAGGPVRPNSQGGTTNPWDVAKTMARGPRSVEEMGFPPPKDAMEGIQHGLLNASLGLISPESIATTLAAGGVAHALSGLVNTPMGVDLISKLPGNPDLIRKAVDLASKMAVPAAFTAQNVKQGAQAIPGIFYGATPAERATKATEAATNVLLGAAGMWGMRQGAKLASELHPPAPETVTPAYEGAPTSVPTPEARAAAPEVAQVLEQSGQRLAAKSWKELADWGATSSKPFQVQAGDQTITFEPVGKGYVRAINQNGEVIRAASGSIEQAKSWLDQNVVRAKANPEGGGGVSIGSGAAELADIPQVAVTQAAPKSLYDRAIEIADSQPSFGASAIQRQLGIKLPEANALLGRLVTEGVIKQTTNGKGSTVYHRLPPAPPPAEPAAATAPEAQPIITPGPVPAPAAGQDNIADIGKADATRPVPVNEASPTAETKTTPEKPETTTIQVNQLEDGQRRVVMIPEGTEAQKVPVGMRRTTIPGVGQFIFDPKAIGEKEIRAAVKENRLPEILGATEGGLGAPDKSKLEGEQAVVVAQSPEGTEVQSTVTDEANLPTAVSQAEQLTPAGGKVEITSPEEVIAERQGGSDIAAPPAIEEPHKFSSTQVQLPEKFAARARDTAAGNRSTTDIPLTEPVKAVGLAIPPKELKPSKLAQGVEEKAIANKLTDGFEGKPEYETVKVAEQAKMAADLIRGDPDKSIRIAMGAEAPPDGLLPESVFVAVENHATANKDVNLLRELATTSSLSSHATAMGQRISMLAARDPNSPVAAIQKIAKAREEAATQRYGAKARASTKTQIRTEIKLANKNPKTWTAFIDSITCN